MTQTTNCLYTGPATSCIDCCHGYEPPWFERWIAQLLVELDLRDYSKQPTTLHWVDQETADAIKAGRDAGFTPICNQGPLSISPRTLPFKAFNWGK